MDFGVQLATSSHSWKVVKHAEELGFTHAWFYDTQLLNADVFVAMAAAAMQTSRIRLCTGVLIPSNRIAPVAQPSNRAARGKEPPLRQHHHLQAVLRHVNAAIGKLFHLRIPSLLMRARAQATVRVWKNRLEHQAHSRSHFRGACGLPVATGAGS
jgi:luciferase-like monooxygenase